MGTEYVRQSSFSNGDVVDAPLFIAEFDQLVAAFAAVSGHTHDGTPAEGGYVPIISDPTAVTSVKIDVTDVNDHKIIFTVDGVVQASFSEVSGFSIAGTFDTSVTTLNDVSAGPTDQYFWKWVDTGGGVFEVQYVPLDASSFAFDNAGTSLSSTLIQTAIAENNADIDAYILSNDAALDVLGAAVLLAEPSADAAIAAAVTAEAAAVTAIAATASKADIIYVDTELESLGSLAYFYAVTN